jgi:transglutaminase-like putative cysteine protease
MRLSNHQFNLLAVSALIAVSVHLARLPWWLSGALLLVAPLRMFGRARTGKTISAWLRVPLVLLLIATIILHYGNLFGREPGSALACGLLVLKLLESERARDARTAAAFAAFVLMSALLFSQSIGYTLLVSSSLIVLLATLNSLEPAPLKRIRPLDHELRTATLLLGLGLPLAAAAFLFTPRLGSPLWGAPGAFAEARTGLDDSMSPGSMTELLVDDSPAFRVRFETTVPAPAARYFRSIVLPQFDGTTWTRQQAPAQPELEPVVNKAPPIDYEVTFEPSQRPWLVALDVPLSAAVGLRMRSDRTLSAVGGIRNPNQYRVRSVLSYQLAPELDPVDRRRALQLPEGFDPKTRELARRWRAEGRDDDAVIASALALFNAQFTYTLSAPLLGRNSVDDFLFETRAGFCEHFSSAFVVLMRAADIPARVVTGYQGGWWSEVGEYLLVRQSDAHAWSEVWLEGRGWVRVDPTAAVDPQRIESGTTAAGGERPWYSGSWWLPLRNRLDVINRLWTQSVVQFNALRQKSLLQPVGISSANQRDLLLALAGAFAIILLSASLWVMRSGRSTTDDALDAAWRRLCRRLARGGLRIRDHEGPLDFLDRGRAAFVDTPARARLEDLVGTYVGLRYAVSDPVSAEVQAFARKVREFRAPPRVQ